MASDAIAKTDDESTRIQAQLLSGRRMRQLRENFTAYLFLAPAIILIFTFGVALYELAQGPMGGAIDPQDILATFIAGGFCTLLYRAVHGVPMGSDRDLGAVD